MPKPENINDRELLENFYSDHNNEWLGILLSRYTLLLLGVCMKYLRNEEDAKDAVQQIFLKVINELHKYRVDYFKSWIYMIAKNYCLMRLREKGNIHTEVNEHISVKDETEEIDTVRKKEATLNEMNAALHLLSKEQQQCIILFYLEKKSYAEVAAETGIGLMQVKSNIQNGKRNLKLMLEKKIKNHNA